ncbi:hypothetical protein J3R83DRAFT_12985 [Lanmaoa asiatica]|nr:hypothetical protein J3R83DRAFT_12985 [Lanmaoa asiatica]
MASSGALNGRFSIEPRRALLTPSASPSVGPPDRPLAKRPRLRSTPSSSVSATPSMSNESTSSADFNSARRASTLRVLNVWTQLAERYNKRLDEDDILDLYSGAIIKDRGVLRGAPRDYHIGLFAQPEGDQDYPDADQDQEDSEQDDDDNELNALPPSETTTDDDAPISKKELLRGVPPLSATTDAEDLREFLEAERKRRELTGNEEDEEDMSPEQLSVLRKALEEQSQKREAEIVNQAQDVASAEQLREPEVDTTPTRLPTRVPPSDDESEDELALWTHDESTAIYPVARDEPEQGVREVEQEVIEVSDSDEEFEAILTRPPRFTRVSPLPVPRPKEVQQSLQSPPDSERGRTTSWPRSHCKTKAAEVMLKSESRPRSPLVRRKPEVIITRKRKPSVVKEMDIVTFDDGGSDQEAVGRISPAHKGKGKEIPSLVEDSHREKIPKSPGVVSRGRKRKRITSSSASGGPLAQSLVEPESSLRSQGKSTSQSPTTLLQPDDPKPTLDKDVSTPARFECTVAGPSRSLSPFFFASKTQQPTLSAPAYRSLEPEQIQLTSHDHNSNRTLLSDPPTPITHPYSQPNSQRHPPRPSSILSSPDQGTPGLSLPAYPPPPMDPVQTQQAHYLLAQAMHQLSYLISTTMPPYAAYASTPGQPWHHPPPHATYSTPIHHAPHYHGTRPYHTPSSSISRSGLPLSFPIQLSVSPPVEEQRARSRGRSKSRGRRVSFKLDNEEVIGSREHNIQTELYHSGQKIRKQSLEVKREKGKGKATEELDNSLRIEDRGSPPQEVARGRTPGPPSRQKIDVSRGRSLGRR